MQVITSFFVYAILTNLLAFYAYFFADGIVPGDFYNNLDLLTRAKTQLLLKFTTERCILPLLKIFTKHIPSSFRCLCRRLWHNRVINVRKERLQSICLQLADLQLITATSILIILYSTHCTITQYHFFIGSQLAYVSFITFEAIFMTITGHLQDSLFKRLWRYLWILVMFGAVLPTRILTWNRFFLVPDLYGASVQCALDKVTEGWERDSALYLTLDCFLLSWSLCAITVSLFPHIPNLPPFAQMETFIHWALSWPSRHLLRQGPKSSTRKKLFWMALFCTFIPCREIVFSEGFDVLRMLVMLIWAGDNVFSTRAVASSQGRQGDESEWGFGQILPVLLLAIPLSQFVEESYRM